jgi:hypothetical protein
MHVNLFGQDYYFDEKLFEKQMTEAANRPWRTEEIVAIQHRMKSTEDRLLDHLRQTATPDPIQTLRQHLDAMK